MVESSKKVVPWRQAVVYAANEVLGSSDWPQGIPGPVRLEITFTLPRPKSAKKNAVPATRPDVSKLARSTEDALTDAGVYADDGRIVELLVRKSYPGQHSDSLRVPGAVIHVRSAA